MAYSVNSRASSPANELRDALKVAEDQLVKPSAAQVEPLLRLFDKIEELFETLNATELDLRPEESRWESLQNRLLSKPKLITSPANSVGGLPKLRSQNQPATSYWWHLDATVRDRRNRSLRRSLITASTIIGLLLLAYGIMTIFFPPSPEALVVLEATNSIEDDLAIGDWATARQKVELALDAAPGESELWLWDVVLSEQLGDDERALASLDRAREFVNNETALLAALANTRIRVGNLDGAELAANDALEIDPGSAHATFILANVAEARGNVRDAITLFEQASDFATAADDAQLAVISRMRMGTLMQTAPAFAQPAADAEQEPAQNP